MMSLFSSFDYLLSSWSLLLVFLLLSVFSFATFLNSSTKVLIGIVHLNLNIFFCSLKPKKMNKISILLFFMVFLTFFLLNFYSVFSFNFPYTSQTSVVLFISLSIWLSLVTYNILYSFKGLFSHFVPEGSPLGLVPALFLIELVSNLIRPLTLMVRLVANIVAGHLLMILLSSLVFYSPLFFFFYIILNLVEMFVSLIQAYIFSTMLVLYFSEE